MTDPQVPHAPDDDAAAAESPSMMKTMMNWMMDQQRRMEDERRRERFWRNVRVSLVALGMISGPLYFIWLNGQHGRIGNQYAAMVRVTGVIDAQHFANAQRIVESLDRAFDDQRAKGIVMLINSPGGSPVQSAIVRDRLVALRKLHPEKKVWAVGEDMMTSGAYFIAVGAPNICVNRSTLTGSIGVIRDGWGLDKVIQKIGIERRIFTAGQSKSQLDTFMPLKPDDKLKADRMLNAVHEHFKSVVRAGRGDRLKAPEDILFTGDFWTGDQALKMGLVDDLCTLPELLTREFGVDDVKDYTLPPSFMEGISNAIGTQVAERIQSLVQARAAQLLPP